MGRIGSNALLAMLGDWTAGPGATLQVRLADSLRQSIDTGVLEAGTVLGDRLGQRCSGPCSRHDVETKFGVVTSCFDACGLVPISNAEEHRTFGGQAVTRAELALRERKSELQIDTHDFASAAHFWAE